MDVKQSCSGRTPEDVVLVVLIGFCSNLDQTCQSFGNHELVHQVFVILERRRVEKQIFKSITNQKLNAKLETIYLRLCWFDVLSGTANSFFFFFALSLYIHVGQRTKQTSVLRGHIC